MLACTPMSPPGRSFRSRTNSTRPPSTTVVFAHCESSGAEVATYFTTPLMSSRGTATPEEVQGPDRDRRFGRGHQEHARQPVLRHQVGHARPGRERPTLVARTASASLLSPQGLWTPHSGTSAVDRPQRRRHDRRQVAEAILFAVNQPEGVDINHLVIRPAARSTDLDHAAGDGAHGLERRTAASVPPARVSGRIPCLKPIGTPRGWTRPLGTSSPRMGDHSPVGERSYVGPAPCPGAGITRSECGEPGRPGLRSASHRAALLSAERTGRQRQ